MEENFHQFHSSQVVCAICKKPEFEPGYKTPLCHECRQRQLKIKVPGWITGLGIVVALLTIYGLTQIPKSLKHAVSEQHAENDENEFRFLTASKDYEKLVKEHPDDIELNAHLFHAYFMCQDYAKAFPLIDKIAGKDCNNSGLLVVTNNDLSMLDVLLGDTTVTGFVRDSKSDSDLVKKLETYAAEHPDEMHTTYHLANEYFDIKNFKACDSCASSLISLCPQLLPAYGLLAAACREEGEYDRAIGYYDMMLTANKELVDAYNGKARVEFKRHRDDVATQIADSARRIDPEDPMVSELDFLQNYLEGKTSEADKALQKMKDNIAVSGDSTLYLRNLRISTGEIKFR